MTIAVEIIHLPECPDVSQSYMAVIVKGDYKLSVFGGSIAECFKQISISMTVQDLNKWKMEEIIS